MLFEPVTSKPPIEGSLVYRTNEHSFDFELSKFVLDKEIVGYDGFTSICLRRLQLEISVKPRFVIYPWGFWPQQSWKTSKVSPPKTDFKCALRIVSDINFEPGVSEILGNESDWQMTFDSSSGWCCVTRRNMNLSNEEHTNIEFATNVIAQLYNKELVALFMKPSFN